LEAALERLLGLRGAGRELPRAVLEALDLAADLGVLVLRVVDLVLELAGAALGGGGARLGRRDALGRGQAVGLQRGEVRGRLALLRLGLRAELGAQALGLGARLLDGLPRDGLRLVEQPA